MQDDDDEMIDDRKALPVALYRGTTQKTREVAAISYVSHRLSCEPCFNSLSVRVIRRTGARIEIANSLILVLQPGHFGFSRTRNDSNPRNKR
jgi:hypothetical protein